MPACWLLRCNWKEIFPLLFEPSFKWVTTDQEGLCLTKIDKMIKGDDSKKHSKLLPEKSLNISEAENPLLMPDPDESGEIENEEANGKAEEAKDEENQHESDKKESEMEELNKEEDMEDFVDGNISDWLEY